MRHHPSTPLGRLADALHRAYARLFPDRAARSGTGAHHRNPGRPAMLLASAVVRRERAHRALRAECDRMAALLDGVRRGRSESVFYRGKLRREAMAAMRRVPARTRFAGATAVGHVRTAARETAAVAARAARQVGAQHRHIAGQTDEYHDMAAQILERARAYGRTRAAGERSMWAQGKGSLAW